MRSVPDECLFEPWKMPADTSKDTAKTQLIPTPLTDLATATRMAKDRVHQRRRDPEVIEGKKAVIDQHASRQVFRKRQRSTALKASNEKQIGFDF
jgi:deoxyribodipyrimidine photo-lyase